MKKLLSFLVAGIAALGLASCSGDLHNEIDPSSDFAKYVLGAGININDFETFELCGSMTDWKNNADTNIKFIANEDGTYEADFQADAADVAFCFITKTGQWDDYQIGGESMKAGTLPDGITFKSEAGGGKHENGKLCGLTAKKFYKMTVDVSTGEYVVSVASTNPQPFYLAGYYISNSQDAAEIAISNVLKNPKVDKSNYNVTYKYKFKYVSDTNETAGWGLSAGEYAFAITDGSNKYTNKDFVLDTNKDFVETELKTSGLENNKVSNLTDGKNYCITIKTTPEGVVSYKVALAEVCKIVGAKIENLDTTKFTDGTKIIFNGLWCNSWAGGWDSSSAYVGTVSSGTCTASWNAVSVEDAGDYDTVSAILLSDGKTSWLSSASDEEKSAAEAIRIASTYGGGDNAKFTVAADQVNDGEYIIYINMNGVAVGDAITWEIKAKE